MSANQPELLSVVISTRNRGAAVASALNSVLKNNHAFYEIVVVDQSEDDETQNAICSYLSDPRLKYIRSPLTGLSNGRNFGIHHAKGSIIAVTDDDCEVAENWIQELQSAFRRDARIGVVFGTTQAGAHDSLRGTIPAYVVRRSTLARQFSERTGGMGACMAFRREVWEKLNGFDAALGVGACFRAGEDIDFAGRALLAGYYVYETPDASVIHQGFRSAETAGDLMFSYWFGSGAAFVKLLKCGYVSTLRYLVTLAWNWMFHRSAVAESFGAHSSRWIRLKAFVRGMIKAARVPVNKRRGHFEIDNSA